MTNIKITELPESMTITSDDLLVMVDSGNPYVTKKIAWKNIDAPSGIITYGRRNNQWVDMTSPANLQLRYGTDSQASEITPLQGEPVWITDKKVLRIGDGETIGGYPLDIRDSDGYVICKPGDSIEAKYAEARNLTPNGQPLSSNNRGYFIIMPGNYVWGDPVNYTVSINGFDTPYVDILGLGSYKLDYGCIPSVGIDGTAFGGSFPIENNINIKGIKAVNTVFMFVSFSSVNIIEDCDLDQCYSVLDEQSKMINCNNVAMELSVGTFINCNGAFNIPVGKFINCKSGDSGFSSFDGYGYPAYNPEFVDCTAGSNSFNTNGTFTNCVAGAGSFRLFVDQNNNLVTEYTLGKLLYCRLTSGTFAAPSGGGVIRYCINGSFSGVNLP